MSVYDRLMALSQEVRATLLDSLDAICDRELERLFCDMLDECYEPYRLGELEFQASDVLKSCDPVAYRCGFSDYAGSEPYIEIDGVYYIEDDVDRALDEIEEVES